MKAAWYESTGEPKKVLQLGEMDIPEPKADEVLVRLHTSGINPYDTKRRGGLLGTTMQFERVIPHNDGAGIIEAVGIGVDDTRVGERVWLYEAQLGRPFGTAAEYTVLPSEKAVTLPENTSFAEGACLGIPAMTAHYCVFADGAVTDKTILIAGGTGAVGNYAVQLAKWGGAKVIATVGSDDKKVIATNSGADQVINYKSENISDRIFEITDGEGVDRIVEVAFATNLEVNQKIIKPNGAIAAYSSGDNNPQVPFRQFMLKNTLMRFVMTYAMPQPAHQAAVKDITTCLSEGVLQHQIAQELPLSDIVKAHEAAEKGEGIGNIIVEII
ncbi:MAG: NADPH:quinone reductase [Cyanobacteria bacterium P01_G01_bin.39]